MTRPPQPITDPAALTTHWTRIVQEIPWADELRDELRQQGATLCWARWLTDGIGAARFQTPPKLQSRFELAPELLFLLVPGYLQARHVRGGIPREVQSDRTTPSFAFWVESQPELSDRLSRLPLPAGTWLPWSPGCGDQLTRILAHHLPRHDAFRYTSAVRGEQRIGRERLLSQLLRDIEAHSAIGVYGLRKVGKTSLVYGVEESYARMTGEPEDTGLPIRYRAVYADAQTYLTEGISALCGRLATGLLAQPVAETSLADLKGYIIERIRHNEVVCLIVDEFDWLFTHPVYASQAVEFLALLRGLVQTYPQQMKWVLVGRDPRLLNGARINDLPNPTLNFWRPFWVPPLDRGALGDLLRRLGRRMGLDVDYTSKERAFALTLGHPLMARLYGSHLAAATLKNNPSPDLERNLSTAPWQDSATRTFSVSQESKDWTAEILQLLQEHYPDTHALFQEIMVDPDLSRSWQKTRDDFPEEATVLEHFGLVDEASGVIPEILRLHTSRYTAAGAA